MKKDTGWLAKLKSSRRFGRRVIALSLPYFRSEEKWTARGLLATIVGLNLGFVYLLVQFNEWNRIFYDALQDKDFEVFTAQLLRYSYLAMIYVVIAIYRLYLTQTLEMRWRAWMTRHYLERWLTNQAFYHMELARYAALAKDQSPDNPDQRIQEDLKLFTDGAVTLSMGLLNAVVTLLSFVGILWSLSGTFDFTLGETDYQLPGFMVWTAILYCLVGTVITHFIGRPLIALNYQQQRREADFRHHLVRVREYSESIALDRGEAVEKRRLTERFSHVISNYMELIQAQKRLTWFTSTFGQAAVVFPFIVASPRFFSGAIQLGTLMQIASAFGRVQDSLSWFVDNYDKLASWRATADRLTNFEIGVQQATRPAPDLDHRRVPQSGLVAAKDLTLNLPNGERLITEANLLARPGDSVLLRGPSGSGKSTLFRALAGIWPLASGQVQLPESSMFIPQRPYFPNGPLRDALAYPEPADHYDDETLRQALRDALLPELVDSLDRHDSWSQKLSGGEQQRLAIARVMLKKPDWIFADEATSALDPAAEATLYRRLQQQAGLGLISIAHRESLHEYHQRVWTLEPLDINLEDPDSPRFRLDTQN